MKAPKICKHRWHKAKDEAENKGKFSGMLRKTGC